MEQTVLLPEMLEAGLEALTQSRDGGLGPQETIVEIYLAMEGMRQIVKMRETCGSIH